ncbi:MAG: 50S ribosomal protein L23 [Tepidiformaceae bacterium]|tara:strand:- start:127 stop:423 length:297 start_codon:yes stop_codon:yes gene_type:complete
MPQEIHPYSVLLKPLVTEKSTTLAGKNQYVFEVDLRANKTQVKESVELVFDVNVLRVNTMIVKGKRRRYGRSLVKRPDWKKAIVTLKPGDSIELFEGV